MSGQIVRCQHCGSAGSIEFDMCQVCLFDYSGKEEETPVSRLSEQIGSLDGHHESLEEESRVLLAS